jgi:hypothetical protein
MAGKLTESTQMNLHVDSFIVVVHLQRAVGPWSPETVPVLQTMREPAMMNSPPQPERSSLRKRKKGKPSDRHKLRWTHVLPAHLTVAHENSFLNMQLRKINRGLTGTKKREKAYEFVAVAVFLVILYSVGTQTSTGDDNDDGLDDSDGAIGMNKVFVSLTLWHIVCIGLWLYISALVTNIFRESRFINLLYWMIIYLPLLATIASFLFDPKTQATKKGSLRYFTFGEVVGFLLFVAEALAVAIHVIKYYLYPRLLNSKWFRKKSRAASFWKVSVVSDWTMTYLTSWGRFGRRNTCKYDGERNRHGAPHGIGRWFDDSFDGEVLTGTWHDGAPVAPFFSRHYGKGDVFSAVRIAYVMASDDEFSTVKFWPTSERPSRCGIASVECSVSGKFYNELPRAEYLMAPVLFDEKTSMEEICSNLTHIGTEGDLNVLHIRTNDPRGVQVEGFIHARTGKATSDVDEIVVKFKREHENIQKAESPIHSLKFMPRSRSYSGGVKVEDIAVLDEAEESEGLDESVFSFTTDDDELEDRSQFHPPAKLSMTIDGWIPCKQKEALIFLAGFNCSLQESLQNFGQFIAMTKLDSHVYPILFRWPSGQVVSYHSASRASHSNQNRQNFLHLLKGLQYAGIRNVHIVTHSMGAQTVLGAFCDKSDGSRSDVSCCFQLAPDCPDVRKVHNSNNKGSFKRSDTLDETEAVEDPHNLLICKTLTMLNPDFPLESFRNHIFRSIRRVCRTITVVGDQTDSALLLSQVVNGIGVYCGYRQPDALLPNDFNKKRLRSQYVVGRSIESLSLPKYFVQHEGAVNHLIFQPQAPLRLFSERDSNNALLDRQWLDLDVIDMTGLDTNIANIRHTGFNLNPILLKDLEELLTTGHRAIQRSSLLYRDGNLFSYCHAPAFVAM